MRFIGATGIFFGGYRLVLGVAVCCKHRSIHRSRDTCQADRNAPLLAPAVAASTSQVAGG
jgi:hypothetical protein